MAWRWASASSIGTSHIQSGDRLQDAHAISVVGEDHVFAVVSDGAGSAKFGRYGAWLVCRKIKVCFRRWLEVNEGLPDDETLKRWIDDLRDCIAINAERRGCVSRQFASTLAALFLSPNEVLALQIGDSAIVGRCKAEWKVICWPETGEYASTTHFVTDHPKPLLKIIRKSREHDAFALFTDGVGELALSQLEQRAHPGFFEPMMTPVDESNGTGRLSDLSGKLLDFLAGDSVCKRTDDDKTLILLSEA